MDYKELLYTDIINSISDASETLYDLSYTNKHNVLISTLLIVSHENTYYFILVGGNHCIFPLYTTNNDTLREGIDEVLQEINNIKLCIVCDCKQPINNSDHCKSCILNILFKNTDPDSIECDICVEKYWKYEFEKLKCNCHDKNICSTCFSKINKCPYCRENL